MLRFLLILCRFNVNLQLLGVYKILFTFRGTKDHDSNVNYKLRFYNQKGTRQTDGY